MPATFLVTESFIAHNHVGNYFTAGSIAILFYDYFLTFSAEVKYVWLSPWSVGKVLFLLVRYSAFFDAPLNLSRVAGTGLTPNTCQKIYIAMIWSFAIGLALSQAVLALRTWAVWECNRRWAIGLAVVYGCAWVAIFAIVQELLASVVVTPSTSPAISGCLVQTFSKIIFLAYLIIMLFETFIFVATIVKGFHHLRRNTPLLVNVLYRDAAMFSTFMLIVSLTNVVLFVAAPVDLAGLLLTTHRVAHAVVSGRIILNLRAANIRASSGATTTTAAETEGVGSANQAAPPESLSMVSGEFTAIV